MSRPSPKNAVFAVALAASALAVAIVTACATGSRPRARGDGSPPRAIWLVREDVLDARLTELSWPDWPEHRDAVVRMYSERGFTPAWVRKGRPTKSAHALIAALERSKEHGLTAGDYDAGRWAARVKSLRDADVTDLDRARFDLALTVSVMRYVSDLHHGQVDPRRLGWRLPAGNDAEPSLDLARVVDELSTASDTDALLASVEPPHPQYRRLMRALDSYRKLARTEEKSSTPLERRVRQIELELERWRSMPGRPERQAIVVNLPEFRLRAFDESGQLAFTSAVVVGESRRHPTPLFTELMSTVVFRPGWYVPSSITRREIVPKLEKDPAHLSSEGYEILGSEGRELTTETLTELRRGTLRLRQRPGPGNALGPVKFLFPNRWNVYLHGTPQTAGFTPRAARSEPRLRPGGRPDRPRPVGAPRRAGLDQRPHPPSHRR